MKTLTPCKAPSLRFPNGSTRRQNWERLLDLLLVAAICGGLAAALLFLLTL